MRAVVCVPWRPTSESRTVLWDKVRLHYEQMGLEVVTGDGDPAKPFNRSAARNAAAANAGEADVYLFVDADTYIPEDQLLDAAWQVVRSGGVALPYTRIKAMNPVTGETQERVQLGSVPYTTSGNVVVSAKAWETLRWDERLCDWGWEDGAFLKAASMLYPLHQTFGSIVTFDHARLPSEVHDIVLHERPAILAEYDAATTPEAMRLVLQSASQTGT